MSVWLAPKPIVLDTWVREILDSVTADPETDSSDCILDPVLVRFDACAELADQPTHFAESMSKRGMTAIQGWAAGFSHACGQFGSHWSGKSAGADDRVIMKRVSNAVATSLDAAELKILGQWIEARDRRNTLR